MLTHTALEVDAEGAVAWAAAHPGWYIFPGKLVPDETGTRLLKKPLARWTAEATKDPDEIRALWRKYVGDGTAVVCVACSPSNIWVLDQDRDLPDDEVGREWAEILDAIRVSRSTLVLRSCTKARPHYVFRQGAEWVAESTWLAGDVKAAGIIFISASEPIVDALPMVAPKRLLEKLKKGRVRGSHGRSACTAEEMWDWLGSTPDPEHLILDAGSGQRFLDAVIAKMDEKIERGEHRRQACLDAVFQAAVEAEAGCYPAETAYHAIKDAYRAHRESRGETGDKGWSRAREADFDLMWKSLIPDIRAGEHDAKIEETRAGAVARYGGDEWLDSDEEINRLMAGILRIPLPEPEDGDGAAGAGGVITGVISPPAIDSGSVDTGISSGTAAGTAGTGTGITDVRSLEDPAEWGLAPAEDTPEEKALLARDDAPTIDEAAFWGPHGELVEAFRGRTESSDVGVLAALLAFSGAALGGKAHFRIGVDVHGPNDYFLNVGVSSAARKSSALSLVEKGVFYDHSRMTGPGAMFLPRRASGYSSGEIMTKIWQPTLEDDGAGGKEEIWPERRVMMIEGEASIVWKKAAKDGSVLGDVFCKTWDQADLATHAVTSGSTAIPADRHLMAFLGCSTIHVAVKAVKAGDGTDAKSGFANRFVWIYLPDSGVDLPFGADMPTAAIRRYQDRLGLFDGSLGRLGPPGFGPEAKFAPDAADLWREVYGIVKRDKGSAGFIESMLSRAESHVLRIALNYWLVAGGDPSKVGIEALQAALAVWRYAKASVEFIFAGSTGDRAADDLVAELEIRGGWATLEELRADLNKNTLAGNIKKGMEAGVLMEGVVHTGKAGRPPRAVCIAEWQRAGRLATTSAGFGGRRGTPLEVVAWKR